MMEKMVYLYHPVDDLKQALTFYRETLGYEEAWREGKHTAALTIPGSTVRLLLEEDEKELGPGAVFLVNSVDEFHLEKNGTLTCLKEPFDIPPGRYAVYQDPSGNALRIIDFSNES
ncbi:VOC family protein [Rossellomorea marisflavi]